MHERHQPPIFQVSTTATTRINGLDAVSLSIAVAQTVFPVIHPNCVVLARPDFFPEVLAATRLLHAPFEAALLFTESEQLEEAVSRELIRLSPRGHGLPAQVVVVGSVHAQVLHDLARLGFACWHLIGHDVWDTVDRINRLDIAGSSGDALLVSSDPLAGGVVAGAYAAQAGTPILFASEQGLLQQTAQYLRSYPKTRVFVVSPESYLPSSLTSEIRQLGSRVEGWIGGADSPEMSTRFARYRSGKPRFGFGLREQSGAPMTIVPLEQWAFGVAAAALAVRGTHTPLLLTRRSQVPRVLESFLHTLCNRARQSGPHPHAFVVGGLDAISYPAQLRLHSALTGE